MLESVLTGIEQNKEIVSELITKVASALSSPPDEEVDEIDNEEELPTVRRFDKNHVVVKLSKNQLELIEEALLMQIDLVKDIHFSLHNILCVATWGAFEGYIQSSLAETFTSNPILLSPDKKLTVSEILSARENLLDYLVAREVDDIGRKSFNDLQLYLKSKIHFQFSNIYANHMHDLYFLRNVIAHSAGFLRIDQIDQVPEGVNIDGKELRISQDYLTNSIECIEKAAEQLHLELTKRSLEKQQAHER